MKKMVFALLCVVVLVKCSPATPTIDPALFAAQTEVGQLKSTMGGQEKTLSALATQNTDLLSATPEVIVKEITQTSTPTPEYTPTITNTPTNTNTPTPTEDPLKKSKGNGFYLIGTEIAPGVWKSTGSGDGCYWAVTRADGDIIDNHFGMSGGTAYISPNGFQVQFEDCGTWTFLQDP